MSIYNFTKWIVSCVILVLLPSSKQVSYDNLNCIVDTNQPATATNNYIDCSADLQVKLGRTECCKIDGAKGCCKPGDSWEQMRLIGICLGATTAGLALLFIYWNWIRKSDHPKLVQCRLNCRKKYHGLQENCSCIPCCRRQVEIRREKEELEKQRAEYPDLDFY